MSKLLNAGFARMIRNKVLLICLAILSYFYGINPALNALQNTGDSPDSFLLSGLIMVSVMTAVFVTSYLGAEHRFGTIRNKLIVGQSRVAVYGSSFLLCLAGMLMMFALVWILMLAVGNLLMGGFTKSSQELWLLFLRSFLAMTALTALYTAIALCIHSKSKSSVASVICAFVLLISSVVIVQMLMEPEYYPADSVAAMAEDIEFQTAPDDPTLVINPYYLSGTERTVYQTFYDLCPVSQMLDETTDLTPKAVLIPVAEIAVLLAAGMYIFKKRDLK